MEDFPGRLPDAKPNDNRDKKKERKKGANLRLSQIAAVEGAQKNKPAKLEDRPDGILANLAIKRPETAEKPTENKEKPKNSSEDAVPTKDSEPEIRPQAEEPEQKPPKTEAAERIQKHEQASEKPDDAEVYEPLPNQERKPSQLGVEILVDLRGTESLGERVIPLHGEIPEETEELAPANPEVPYAVFTRQVEQQHQGREEPEPQPAPELAAAETANSPEKPEPTTTGGGEVPPTEPPETHRPTFEQPPEQPWQPTEVLAPRPEDIYSPIPTAEAPPVAAGERPASKQEVEDALYQATKVGQNRGVLTGLLVGGAYEHFKHKRREKKAEKRFQKQTKQLESARKDYQFGLQEQTKQQTETNRRFSGIERRFGGAQKPFENPSRPEKMAPTAAEQSQIDTPEQLAVPSDHRLETSAWHTIEIDSKTGKPVETPTFQYGHEYYRERAQENTPATQRHAATGEVALVAAAAASSAGAAGGNGPVPPAQIPDATIQGAPTSGASPSARSAQIPTVEPSSTAGPLWPWLVALAVVAICLIAVLR